jgi:uncharacterized protein involved in tolerance to divalent cations
MFGCRYNVTVLYPKHSSKPLFEALVRQCKGLNIPVVDSVEAAGGLSVFDCAVDAIFGFSFHGAPRPPFDDILAQLTTGPLPVLSVDVPSGWDVAHGDPSKGDPSKDKGLQPTALVSLTAPKLCAQYFTGRHFVGGRFVPPFIAEKYNLKLPAYQGVAQVAELLHWGRGAEATAVEESADLAPSSSSVYKRLKGVTDDEDSMAVVWVTTSAGEATTMAKLLVNSQLAACVKIVPAITSVYEWQGAANIEAEAMLMVKTRAALLPELTDFVQKHHSYEVPETIAAAMVGGNRNYLNWVHGQTKQPESEVTT